MHKRKKQIKLTYANRGEMFESDVEEDVVLDNNEHVDQDFKFKFFVAKTLMHLESKKKTSKCVIDEIVEFATNIASAALAKNNVVHYQVASITQTFGSEHKRTKFYEENCAFVEPKAIVLGLQPLVN